VLFLRFGKVALYALVFLVLNRVFSPPAEEDFEIRDAPFSLRLE